MHPKFWEESFELDPHNKLYQVGLSHNDPNGTFIGFLFPKFTDSLPKNLISYLALAILIKVLVLPQSLNLVGFYMFILNKQGCSYTHSYYNRHFNVTPLAVSHDPRKEATKPKIKEADIACLFKVQVTCGGFDTLFLWFWWWVVAWPYTNRWLVINVIYIYICVAIDWTTICLVTSLWLCDDICFRSELPFEVSV